MGAPRHFVVRARADGPHVRVSWWAGTALQKTAGGRPNLGELCMTPEDWFCLKVQLVDGGAEYVTIEDANNHNHGDAI
jgi:hypothetical protein